MAGEKAARLRDPYVHRLPLDDRTPRGEEKFVGMADSAPFYLVLVVSFLLGAMTHVDPCCGAGTVIWSSALADMPTRARHARLALIILSRVLLLGVFGAFIGVVGGRVSAVWGFGLLILGILYAHWGWKTFRASLSAEPRSCPRPFAWAGESRGVNAALLLIPPPLAYPAFGMAYGGLRAPGPEKGFLILATAALGLSLPLIVLAVCPPLYALVAKGLAGRRWAGIAAGIYVLLGAMIFFAFAAWRMFQFLNPN